MKKLTKEIIKQKTLDISQNTLNYTPEKDEEYLGKDSKGTFTHMCGYKFQRTIGNVITRKIITCPVCNLSNYKRTKEQLQIILNQTGLLLVEDSGKFGDRDKIKIQFKCGCQKGRLS